MGSMRHCAGGGKEELWQQEELVLHHMACMAKAGQSSISLYSRHDVQEDCSTQER